jgi:predicted transcriptional regulator
MITGKLIKKMREECGLTQQQLAEAVGITQAHVAKIENERVNPRLSTINKIISVLKTNKTLKCESFITKKIISAKPDDSVHHVVKLMRENDISQIPIMEGEKCVGSVSEKTIVRNLDRISGSTEVKDLMDEPFPIVSYRENVDLIKTLLEYHQAVLVSERGRIIGIVTKSDLLNLLK